MITKLNEASELLKLCQEGKSCEECDATNDFDCVAQLMYTYHIYCANALEELNRKEEANGFSNEDLPSNE